jgi:glycosyltransferase involved in cell wall biosynthesis
MRVLLTYVVVGRGGDAIQWTSLAEGFRLAGHHVVLIGAGSIRPYGVGTTTARVRTLARRLPWWIRDALELILTVVALGKAWWTAREKVDLVVHRAATYDVMGRALAMLLRVPIIAYLDTHVPAERHFRSESYWVWLHKASMRSLGRTVVLLVTPSEAVRDYYRDLGIPAAKLLVQRNSVFERHIRLGLEATRASPPMASGSACVLGFVGSLSDWHRVDVLVDALALLAAWDGTVTYRLVVIGTGREDTRLRALAARLGVAHLVEWRGPLPHDRAVAAIAEFDIAVLPSTLPTGAPIKLVEYAAMGRPIIAPALPNIRDLLSSGTEAILVEPGDPVALADAVVRLARDPALAQQIGRAAQARVRGWTWEETARLLVKSAFRAVGPGTKGSLPSGNPVAVAGTGNTAGRES